MSSIDDDDDPPAATLPQPLSAGEAKKQRILLTVVIILGILMLVGFAVLVAGFIMGGASNGPSRGEAWQQTVNVRAGSQVVYSQVDGNRVIVRVASPAGEEIVLVDAVNGKLIGRVAIVPAR